MFTHLISQANFIQIRKWKRRNIRRMKWLIPFLLHVMWWKPGDNLAAKWWSILNVLLSRKIEHRGSICLLWLRCVPGFETNAVKRGHFVARWVTWERVRRVQITHLLVVLWCNFSGDKPLTHACIKYAGVGVWCTCEHKHHELIWLKCAKLVSSHTRGEYWQLGLARHRVWKK